jgi:L-fuconolactonase
MEIIDAQIHPPQPLTAWGDGDKDEQARRDVELGLSAMDSVGVDAAVIHADEHFNDVAWKMYPDRFRGMVDFLEPTAPDIEGTVAHIKEHPGLVGFRVIPSFPPNSPKIAVLQQGGYEPWFKAAERHDVPVVLFLWGHLPEAHKIAKAHPGLTLVIDHMGMGPIPLAPLTQDRLEKLPELLELAQYPNVAVKMTGVAGLSLEKYPFRDLWDPVKRVIDAFGTERLMWGSDFTRLMMGPNFARGKPVRTYAEIFYFMKHVIELSESDQEKLFGGTLRRLYRWEKE